MTQPHILSIHCISALRNSRRSPLRFMLTALLFVTSLQTARSQQLDTSESVDSMLQTVLRMPLDTTRLRVLQNLFPQNRNTPAILKVTRQLVKDATKLKNKEFIYSGWYQQELYFQSRQLLDSVHYYCQKVKQLTLTDTTNLGNRYYFHAWRNYTSVCISQNNLELARIESLKMEQEAQQRHSPKGLALAYSQLAEVSLRYRRYEVALDYYNKALSLKSLAVSDEASIYATIGNIYLNDSCYAQGARYYEKAIATYRSQFPDSKFPRSFYDVALYNCVFAAFCHLEDNRPDLCKHWLDEATQYYYKDMMIGSYLYYNIFWGLYEAETGNYERSMSYFDEADKRQSLPVAMYITKENRIRALLALHRYEEAVPLMKDFAQIQAERQQLMDTNNRAAMLQNARWTEAEMEHQRVVLYASALMAFFALAILIFIVFITYRILKVHRALLHALHLLDDAKKDAEQTDHMKESFMRNISHDVRVPLSAIIGFSQLLVQSSELDTDERRQIRTILKENSDRLMNLVNNVLDLSRLESGKMKYQITSFDLAEVCREAVFQLQNSDDKRCVITFETTCAAPVMIEHDLQRMLKTLVSAIQIPSYVQLPEGTTQWTEKMILNVEDGGGKCKRWKVTVENSPLSAQSMESEEQSILNRICSLYMKVLGASYQTDLAEMNGKVTFEGTL